MDELDLKEKREQVVKSIKSFFSSTSEEKDEFTEKRVQAINFIKEKKQWIIYILLAVIIWFSSVYIRTKNFWLLKDVTNGSWLSVDLDSHIYLKYAKVILQQGYLPAIDMTRFVPLGAPTANYAFPAYVIYYLYKFIHLFDPSVTIEYVDVIYPIIAFAIGLIFFFLLARKIFDWKVALISTFGLSIMPAFLQRTMGGSSDHDALGMMFFIMSLYFFVVAWQSKDSWKAAVWGAVAGLATGMTGLSWGAWKFLALIFGLFVLIEFLLKKVQEKEVYLYGLWLVVSIITMTSWVPLFTLKSLVMSITTAFSLIVLLILIVDLLLFKYLKLKEKIKWNLPTPVISIIVSIIVGVVLLFLILGPTQLSVQAKEAYSLLLHPMGKDRWELTVAEQHQPYFSSWVYGFGPLFGLASFSFPLLFTLYVIGIAIMVYNLVINMKKRVTLTGIFLLFFAAIVLSRYSGDSVFNGVTFTAKLVYFGSFIAVAGLFVYYYLQSFYKEPDTHKQLLEWNSNYLIILIWMLFMLLAARGAIRLVFVFAPVVALLAGYAVVQLASLIRKVKNKAMMYTLGVILIFVLLSPLAYPYQGVVPSFIGETTKQATYAGPPYNQQWQIAGAWVRENIPKNAVFGHWWDYGYWVQNGWERASVLDGANKVKYWNYLMGRHVLTGQTQEEALEFLYAHNTTNFLIVSEEIGKYTAYSSIGSDQNYDRYSWITTFIQNPEGTQETRNTTVFFYQGGFMLDDDFVWKGKVYPRTGAGIGAVFLPIRSVEKKSGNDTIIVPEFERPTIALVQNGQRVDVPLNCVYFNGEVHKFEGEGYNGCFRLVPTLNEQGKPENFFGAGLFLSEKAVRALWVQLYVLEQRDPDYDTSAFKSVYSDSYMSTLALFRSQIIGPIKIWEIEYPKNFTVDEETKQRYLAGNEMLEEWFFKV